MTRGLHEMKGFYNLRCSPEYMRVKYIGHELPEPPTTLDMAYRTGEKSIRPNVLSYKKVSGKLGDFNDDGAKYCYGLVSDRFRDCVLTSGLTGCTFHRASVELGRGKGVELNALIVRGRCHSIPSQFRRVEDKLVSKRPPPPALDHNASAVEAREILQQWSTQRVHVVEKRKIGFYFDPSTWDHSDFFVSPTLMSPLLCTERAKDALLARGLSGCEFEALETYDWGPA